MAIERYKDNVIDNVILEYNDIVITEYELEKHINQYIQTLNNPDDIYNKSTKAFNGLLLYLYNHLIKYIIPDTWNNDYNLYNDIFYKLYIPLSYRYNRVCSINLFCILIGVDYNYFYDIKTGTYKNTGIIVNPNNVNIVKNWINFCNSELIEDVVTTNGIGSMFRAKVHGFREDNTTNVNITVNMPSIGEKQLASLASGVIPELPNSNA